MATMKVFTKMRGVYPDEKDLDTEDGDLQGDENIVTFTLAELRRYTDDFAREIGRGISRVFRGTISERTDHHQNLNDTEIAVKILAQDFLHRAIWVKELKHAARFRNHPNIITLIGKCETNKRLFLIFPYIRKGDLFHCISSRDLKWQQALNILEGTTKAINELHKQNPPILYNDLKPKNILVNEDFQPILCDFGSVCNPGAKLSHGSRGYSEPIVSKRGTPDVMTDIYSIGLLILQVLMKANVQKDLNGYLVKSVLQMVRELQHKEEGVIVHQDLISSGCTAPDATQRITNLGFNCLNGERLGREVNTLLGRDQGLETRFTVEQILEELAAIREGYPPIDDRIACGCLPFCTCVLCCQPNLATTL